MEDFERICERVGNVRDEAVAQGARIVHRTKQVKNHHFGQVCMKEKTLYGEASLTQAFNFRAEQK